MLDIKELFPNLDRVGTFEAVSTIHKEVAARLRKRVGADGLGFAIHKRHREMDRIGRGDNGSFWNLTFAEVLNYVEWDLHHNSLFVMGNRVWDQIRGVAIGGPLSAQLASMFCMVREAKFYERGEEAVRKSVRRFLPHKSLPVRPFRFRDNIVGIGRGTPHMDKLQRLFEHVIGLPLQQEGHGGELQTLEAMVRVREGGVLELGLKDKTALRAKPNPVRKIIRYPDVFAPNAKSTLRSLIPALAKKCVFYSTSTPMTKSNCQTVIFELRYKGYPKAWWVNSLKMGLKKFGLPEGDWREMHSWFREEHGRVA